MRKIVTMAMLCTVATLGSMAQEPAALTKQAAEAKAIQEKLHAARVGVESRRQPHRDEEHDPYFPGQRGTDPP